VRGGSLAAAFAASLLACGVRAPPRPPERTAARPEPAAAVTTAPSAAPSIQPDGAGTTR
jgi:hypothetical protein